MNFTAKILKQKKHYLSQGNGMKKLTLIIGFIAIFILLVHSNIRVDSAPSPSVEYDLTNLYNFSLDLSNNGKNSETIINWWKDENSYCEGCQIDENMRPRLVHGVFYTDEKLLIKNNGDTNLTNVTVIGFERIIEIISLLAPNESFPILYYDFFGTDTEIFTDQGVYAKIYTIDPGSGNCWTFQFTIFSFIFLIFAILTAVFSIFYLFKYKKIKKKSYLIIFTITITIAILAFIFAILFSLVCYP